MQNYRHTPSRRALYRHAKKNLYRSLIRRWTGSRAALEKHIRAFLRGKRHSYLLRLVRQHAFALAVATALLTGATAHATDPIELSDIAMNANTGGFVINGEAADDASGFRVSGAGDVNGDGIQDVIVGAFRADSAAGKNYVVFGTADGTAVELSDVAAGTGGGFAINGIDVDDWSGFRVSGAGDVNGDGLDDLIVGAIYADPGARDKAGESYVVFGKATTTAVNLSDVVAGTGGFVINGIDAGDFSGTDASGAGDVNGDGLADLVIGAKRAALAMGEAYVVFGKASTTPVELSDIAGGTGGFIINSSMSGTAYAGYSVTGAGDVNGDGLDDLVLGAHLSQSGLRGRSFVIFGKSTTTAVELSAVGSAVGIGGFLIDGFSGSNRVGLQVSGAGDVNGDGLADVIIGSNNEAAYVVFGKDDNTNFVTLNGIGQVNSEGFWINEVDIGDLVGASVSGAGDVNGDGLADLIVGARGADPNGSESGESYVVFGKASTAVVELSDIAAGTGGFVINGIDMVDVSGLSVSGAGDVNGDGLADLIVGAPGGDPNGSESGESYFVFSPETAPASATYKKTTRVGDGAGGEIVVPTVMKDARFTIDYSDEDSADDGSGGASLETVTLHRDNTGITNFPSLTLAGVYWELLTNRTGWTSADITLKFLDSEVDGLFGPESSYTVFTAPAASGPWTPVFGTVDTARNTVTFTTTTDTVFALGTSPDYETWVDFGYVGNESGTVSEPFNTIAEAMSATSATGVIHLIDTSGDRSSSETLTLTRPMTINTLGGPHTIGAPAARDSGSGFVSRGPTPRE